jgi:hypothetical protein
LVCGPKSKKGSQKSLISVFLLFLVSASAVFNNLYTGLFRKTRDGEIRGQKFDIMGGWAQAPVTGRFFLWLSENVDFLQANPGGEARRGPC